METKSIEQVKEHFKDAKKIKCAFWLQTFDLSKCKNKKYSFSQVMPGDVILTFDNGGEDKDGIWLWDAEKGKYATIIE